VQNVCLFVIFIHIDSSSISVVTFSRARRWTCERSGCCLWPAGGALSELLALWNACGAAILGLVEALVRLMVDLVDGDLVFQVVLLLLLLLLQLVGVQRVAARGGGCIGRRHDWCLLLLVARSRGGHVNLVVVVMVRMRVGVRVGLVGVL